VSIYKACDIRGVYPEELDEALYARFGQAIGTLLRPQNDQPSVLVGGDVRPSTAALQERLVEGLLATGCRVTDLGAVPTPVVYFAARRRQPHGLAIVTASHNPPEYNGLKLCLGPLPVTPEQMHAFQETVETGTFVEGKGTREHRTIENEYLDAMAETDVDLDGLRMVLDCGNGTFSSLAPQALQRAGCDVIELFCTPDGTFPNRSPNPSVPENLGDLCHRVTETGAQLGVALDGDGDRLALVDDAGRPVSGDEAIMLLARHVLGPANPGEKVVCDLKCSQAVLDTIRECRGAPLLERSGHAFIKTRMIAEGARFGGELSGHFFYRELDGGDDALYSILRAAELVQAADPPLSALVDSLPRFAITADLRIPYDAPDGAERLDQLAQAAEGEVLRLDGVRVSYPDGWALARCSVTEPLLTFRFESFDGVPRRIAERFLAPAPDLRRRVLERLDESGP
jgi:phosphomannomutase/phosphoglucomutase